MKWREREGGRRRAFSTLALSPSCLASLPPSRERRECAAAAAMPNKEDEQSHDRADIRAPLAVTSREGELTGSAGTVELGKLRRQSPHWRAELSCAASESGKIIGKLLFSGVNL